MSTDNIIQISTDSKIQMSTENVIRTSEYMDDVIQMSTAPVQMSTIKW